jgi:hypothetical protein
MAASHSGRPALPDRVLGGLGLLGCYYDERYAPTQENLR